jgi:hypothetical protein
MANSARAVEQTKLFEFGNLIRKGISQVFAWSGRSAADVVGRLGLDAGVRYGSELAKG